MNDQIVTLIHYGELSLKGKNRSLFENKLKENIERETGGKVTKYRGRFVLENGEPEHLKNVFGISWYAEAIRVDKNYDSIRDLILSKLNDYLPGKNSFGVFVKRSDKSFPYISMELERKIGSEISKTYSIKVNLKSPELSVFIEIADDVYLYFRKKQGLKGLPVDVSGNVLSLLSGGIDSPVASYLMMKRGCRVNFIHFHVFTKNTLVNDTKMRHIFESLNKYQGNSRIFLVPYYQFEMAFLEAVNTRGYELILFRRFMVRVAEGIVLKNGFKALVTGDSLGQVASQTMENIAQITKTVSIPIFQPLIAYDKQEIVDLAKKIDTYELSIENYKDCCSIVSSNPRTKANTKQILELEERMNIDEVIEETLKLVSVCLV
jgi:thiamine biosynthesis protein ThiI